MSAPLSIRVDLESLHGNLRAMDRQARNLTGYYRELRAPLREDQTQHAKEQSGPDGAWQPRSPFTIAKMAAARRAGSRRRDRKLLGRLPRAITVRADSKGARAVSLVKWSMAHAQGARVGRGARLPQRQWLWLSPRIIQLAGEIAAKYCASVWGRS